MGKKAPAQVVIEEEDDFNEDFSFDESDMGEEAPETLNRSSIKRTPISKSIKKEKKKPKKASKTLIRGGDIFAVALPETEVHDLKAK